MPKQLFSLSARAEGRRDARIGPGERPIRAWLATGSERGMYLSTTPTVELETVRASGINRLVAHVGLRDETAGSPERLPGLPAPAGFGYVPVLEVVAREHPAGEAPLAEQRAAEAVGGCAPGVYVVLPSGRRILLDRALATLDALAADDTLETAAAAAGGAQ